MCIEVVKENDKYVIGDDGSHHMIAHIKLTEPWKENQIRHRKKANPGHQMGEEVQYFFILFQNEFS